MDIGPFETYRGKRREWYKFWETPGIKAYSSKTFSWNVQSLRLYNQIGPNTFVQYVTYSMEFYQLDFEGYGFLDIKEYGISLYLEMDLTSFSPSLHSMEKP